MAAGAAYDDLYARVQKRMIESGEWDRMLAALRAQLNESGWVDETTHRTKELALSADGATFKDLLAAISPAAQSSIPPAIREDMLGTIRAYLDSQFK